LTGQWAARVHHLLLFVATAWMLFKSTPRSTRSSINVDCQVFVGRPRHLQLPPEVHDMTWLAGRPGGILIIWPAIRSHLSATMSCNLRCPVRLSISMLVTWSFHVMPRISRKLSWWDVQLLTYSSCTLPSLAGVYGCRDNEGGVEVQFNLEAKRAGSPNAVRSSEDCWCFYQSSVDICFNISIARYYTSQVGQSLYIFYVPLCNGYWLWWWMLGDSHGLRFYPAYI